MYTFTNLLPGLYQVIVETNPAGYVSVAYRDFGNHNITVVLASNQNITTRDFEDTPITGDVTRAVFTDLDGDGVPDPGEAPLNGVTLTIYGPGVDGILYARRHPGGNHHHQRLRRLHLHQPAGRPVPGLVETDPPGYLHHPQQRARLRPPQRVAAEFLGDQPAATISGVVFDDNNGNGAQGPRTRLGRCHGAVHQPHHRRRRRHHHHQPRRPPTASAASRPGSYIVR